MKKAKPRIFDSMRSAAAVLRLPYSTVKAAKDAGCRAFKSNRVNGPELVAWIKRNPKAIETVGQVGRTKLLEQIRKLRLANDATEARLVNRAWVSERLQRALGELGAFRAKSEAEHPTRFASAGGDIALCRTVVRGIWDDIFRDIASLGKHFEEDRK